MLFALRSSRSLAALSFACVTAFSAAPASAEEPPAESGYAFGLSAPLRWPQGSIGGQMSLGFKRHHAVRVNLASYKPLLHPDEETSHKGATTDFGAGWVIYPRSLWSGPMFELGGVVRLRDLERYHRFADIQTIRTDTTTYAARALLGWSWRLGDRFTLAAAAGSSLGYETGKRIEFLDDGSMPVTSSVKHRKAQFEAYFRFGVAFDNPPPRAAR